MPAQCNLCQQPTLTVALFALGYCVVLGPMVIASWILSAYCAGSTIDASYKLTVATFVLTLGAFVMPSQLFTLATRELLFRFHEAGNAHWAAELGARNLPELIVALASIFTKYGLFSQALVAGVIARDIVLSVFLVMAAGRRSRNIARWLDTQAPSLSVKNDMSLLIFSSLLVVVAWIPKAASGSLTQVLADSYLSTGLSTISLTVYLGAYCSWLYNFPTTSTQPEGPSSDLSTREQHHECRPLENASDEIVALIWAVSAISIIINALFFFGALDNFVRQAHVSANVLGTLVLPLVLLLGGLDTFFRARRCARRDKLRRAIKIFNAGAIFAALVIHSCAVLLASATSNTWPFMFRMDPVHAAIILASVLVACWVDVSVSAAKQLGSYISLMIYSTAATLMCAVFANAAS